MSDHPNVQVIRDGYAAFSRGDMPGLAELFSDDIQWHEAGGATSPVGGDYKGKEAVFGLFEKLITLTNGQFGVHLDEVTADDRQAVAMHTATAHNGKRTYHSREAIVFHLLDGRVTDAWHTVPDVAAYDEFWETGETIAAGDLAQRTRDGYDAFNRGDVDALMAMMDENIVWHVPATDPNGGTYRGREAVLGYFAALAGQLPPGTTVRVEDMVTADDKSLTFVRFEGRTDDGPWSTGDLNIATWRNGLLTEFWSLPLDPPGDADTMVRLMGRSTPEAVIARTRRGYAAFATGDFDALNEFIDAGAVWHVPGNNRFTGTYTGRDQIYGLFGEMVQASGGDLSIELGHMSSTGLATTCEVRMTMSGRTFEGIHLYRNTADGLRAAECWTMMQDEDAFDAMFPASAGG